MHLKNCAAIRAFTLLAATVASGNAYAADDGSEGGGPYPNVTGSAYLEIGDDWTFDSDDPGAEIHDVYFSGSLDLKFGLTPLFSVNLGLAAEDVIGEYVAFEDRYFKDTGLYVSTLNLQADVGSATMLAGKFHPNFGRAWDNTPGIFGTYFAEDYELTEMVGAGGSYRFSAGGAGTHVLGGAIFYSDNSILSDSIFTSRGQLDIADGGLANTGRLDSFTISLDGSDFAAMPGLSYHAAYRRLSAGVTEDLDENGFVFGLAKDVTIDDETSVTLTGEAAFFSNYTGFDGDAAYFTAGAALSRGQWHGELSGAVRRYDDGMGGKVSDRLLQASAGYTFENGVDLAAGYGFTHASGTDYQTIGLRLSRALEFPSGE